jgi:hypothetical protein
LGAGAQAQSDTSRAEVKADVLQAIRAGNVTVGGEAGLTARQLHPGQYASQGVVGSQLARAEVKAQVVQAQAAGELTVQGEAGLYPRANLVPTGIAVAANHPARAVVKAETLAAIRSGDVLVGGEAGLKANQLFPRRYAPVANQAAAQTATATTATAAGY